MTNPLIDDQGGDTLDITEAMKLLGVSRPTIYNLIEQEVIKPLPKKPYLRRRAKVLFPREEIERVLNQAKTA